MVRRANRSKEGAPYLYSGTFLVPAAARPKFGLRYVEDLGMVLACPWRASAPA